MGGLECHEVDVSIIAQLREVELHLNNVKTIPSFQPPLSLK